MAAAPLITSRQNARVRAFRAALARPPVPGAGAVMGVEGEHLVEEVIRSGLRVRCVMLEASRPIPVGLPADVETVRVSQTTFLSVSQTHSPQGIAALLEPPQFRLQEALRPPALVVVAEALQDPGNLGTLIRSAEAFGATGVLLLADPTRPGMAPVHPFNGKCIRASAGSVFRVPTLPIERSDLRAMRDAGVQLLAATGKTNGGDVFGSVDLSRPTAFLIGNEGAGLSAELGAMADASITVPCTGPVESLNAGVAASILLFSAQQQRHPVRVYEPV